MGRLLAIAYLALWVAGCGSSSSPCESANQKMCDKACACPSSDGKCHMKSGGITISFTRGSGCFMASFGCGGSYQNEYDWPACSAALDTAQCTTLAGTTDMAIELPAVCIQRIADGGAADR
jgi:hypothetical protein